MKRFYFIAIPASTVLVMTGCVPLTPDPYYVPIERQKENVYYIPTTQNAPFLQQKNEGNVAANFSFGMNHAGLDLQASYSPAEHLGLLTNYSWVGTTNDHGNLGRFELGAGYYNPVSPTSLFEVYAGGGFGTVKNRHETGLSNLSNSILFLQPSIGFQKANRKFQVAFIPRLTYVHFNFRDSTFNNDREQFASGQFRLLNDKPNQLFLEPGLVFKAGGENTIVNFGCNVSSNLTSTELNDVASHFHIGINFRLFPAKKK